MKTRPRRSVTNRSKAKERSQNESDSSVEKESNSGSDSDWGDAGNSPSSSEDEVYEEPPPLQQKKKKTSLTTGEKRKAGNVGASRKPPKRKKNVVDYGSSNDGDDFNDDHLPSFARRTDKGGYSHTHKSKARISRANKGNTPWNKQKGWSDDVKARISAGVKARNKKILRVKLKKLGITEDEYTAKRKKIKLLRETVRKKRLAATKHKELLAKLIATREESPCKEADVDEEQTMEEEADEDMDVEKANVPVPIFARSASSNWIPHDYDREEYAYEKACPVGGPGGLICCEACAAAYSQYMTQTTLDMEVQTKNTIESEVQELLGFLSDARKQLRQAVQTARQEPPPFKPPEVARAPAVQEKRHNANSKDLDDTHWDLSTTMGLGEVSRFATV